MSYFSTKQLSFFNSYAIEADEVEKLDKFLYVLDISKAGEILHKVKRESKPIGGRPPIGRYKMFAMISYGFAFTSGTLRELESRARNDLRYLFLLEDKRPTYVTIGNYINEFIVPNIEPLFYTVTQAIMKTCDIGNIEDVYIDGTKIEADANKYKFVWKPTTYHKRLCSKIRDLLSELGLDDGLPKEEIFSAEIIARKVTQVHKKLESCDGSEGKKTLEKQCQLMDEYLEKALEYEEKERICGPDRNSYYKTDHDATAMTLKTDYYSGLGSNMHAAYNVQAVVSHGFVVAFYVSQARTDHSEFIPVMDKFRQYWGYYPKNAVADSGYGTLKNYKYLKKHNIGNYLKHQSWQGNVSGRYPDQYRLNNDLTITCLNGNTGSQVDMPGRHPKQKDAVFYRVENCNGCEFKDYCKRYMTNKDEDFKIFEVVVEMRQLKQEAEENLLSPKGIELRVNRSCQVEGAFGVLKQDMGYDRFRRTSLKKVTAEYALTFLGYNIRKLFSYFDGNLRKKYWEAPEDLKAETFKKPSAKRLSNRVNKKKKKSANEQAKTSYKYKKSKKKGTESSAK